MWRPPCKGNFPAVPFAPGDILADGDGANSSHAVSRMPEDRVVPSDHP